jgi:hypothetical protein
MVGDDKARKFVGLFGVEVPLNLQDSANEIEGDQKLDQIKA